MLVFVVALLELLDEAVVDDEVEAWATVIAVVPELGALFVSPG